jgi:hypothetical protein
MDPTLFVPAFCRKKRLRAAIFAKISKRTQKVSKRREKAGKIRRSHDPHPEIKNLNPRFVK